jgi:uncharacterized protein with HEPN domain
MARSVDPRLQDILDAIARARIADKRMRLGESLGDDVGVQIAYQAILHNLTVIVEAAKAVPAEVVERDAETPWGEFAAMGFAGIGDALGRNYHVIDTAEVHRTVEEDLSQFERAVHRLNAG